MHILLWPTSIQHSTSLDCDNCQGGVALVWWSAPYGAYSPLCRTNNTEDDLNTQTMTTEYRVQSREWTKLVLIKALFQPIQKLDYFDKRQRCSSRPSSSGQLCQTAQLVLMQIAAGVNTVMCRREYHRRRHHLTPKTPSFFWSDLVILASRS